MPEPTPTARPTTPAQPDPPFPTPNGWESVAEIEEEYGDLFAVLDAIHRSNGREIEILDEIDRVDGERLIAELISARFVCASTRAVERPAPADSYRLGLVLTRSGAVLWARLRPEPPTTRCPACEGEGCRPPRGVGECRTCGGEGVVAEMEPR